MFVVFQSQRNGAGSFRRQTQQPSKQTSSSSSSTSASSHHSFHNVDSQMVNVIMNEIMDHGPRVGFDDIGQHRPVRSLPWLPVYKTGPRFTKHLTVYRKIILSLS